MHTMALSDEQKDFLSLLDKGRTIVFSQGWETSLQVQVAPETNTGSKEIISEDNIRKAALNYYCIKYRRSVFPSLKYLEVPPDIRVFEEHVRYKNSLEMLIERYQETFLKIYEASEKDSELIKQLEIILTVEQQAKYLRDYLYYTDENDEKYQLILSLLIDIKNGEQSLNKYNEKLSYGRRTKK